MWAWAIAGAIFALAVLLFFQLKDPMLLIFGLMPGAILIGIVVLVSVLRAGLGGVRVKCRECGALNLEDAKFCAQCGKTL